MLAWIRSEVFSIVCRGGRGVGGGRTAFCICGLPSYFFLDRRPTGRQAGEPIWCRVETDPLDDSHGGLFLSRAIVEKEGVARVEGPAPFSPAADTLDEKCDCMQCSR